MLTACLHVSNASTALIAAHAGIRSKCADTHSAMENISTCRTYDHSTISVCSGLRPPIRKRTRNLMKKSRRNAPIPPPAQERKQKQTEIQRFHHVAAGVRGRAPAGHGDRQTQLRQTPNGGHLYSGPSYYMPPGRRSCRAGHIPGRRGAARRHCSRCSHFFTSISFAGAMFCYA